MFAYVVLVDSEKDAWSHGYTITTSFLSIMTRFPVGNDAHFFGKADNLADGKAMCADDAT